jgi:hypothetical protein
MNVLDELTDIFFGQPEEIVETVLGILGEASMIFSNSEESEGIGNQTEVVDGQVTKVSYFEHIIIINFLSNIYKIVNHSAYFKR